ncbi:helix-turn-helix domain-containing protein [Geomonas agri]|uniref:helix-turn-helix domain-containing protein n=1 Tax=Geomonas agri TaxID=2873702 RepID=UPI001CD5F352|nr:helix-turn-helix transcriptional regulator [Geomonas agri]
MIRFRLRELIIEKEFKENRRITLEEIARATNIQRTTLSRIGGQRGYNTTTINIDRLCEYFGCRVENIMEHIQEPEK